MIDLPDWGGQNLDGKEWTVIRVVGSAAITLRPYQGEGSINGLPSVGVDTTVGTQVKVSQFGGGVFWASEMAPST